jgi:hypothetical protein
MKSFRAFLAIGFVAAAALFAAPAGAAQLMMCAPDAVATATGAHRVQNPVTQNTYGLNSAGCALIAQADIGYFQTQGFTPGSAQNSIIYTTGALPASGTTDIPLPSLPAGAYIKMVVIQNNSANAVTGGVSLGTTANGTDIVAAQAVAANALVFVTDATLLKRVFSATAAQPLHLAPVTSSNTANLTVTIVYDFF